MRNRGQHDQSTVIEKHDYTYWFCSTHLELEVTGEPIEILENDDCALGCELQRWKLSVGGVPVDVRLDGDPGDLAVDGFRRSDIESVVYPEVFGRSERRVFGNEVKRETDLILNGNRVWHLHFRYEAKYEAIDMRVPHIDQMIDRAHIPICLRSDGCEQ